MDPRALVIHLESPYTEYKATGASAREVVLAGLRWSNDYWTGLAIGWIDQGVPVDGEIAHELSRLASMQSLSQGVRHRAFALVRRFTHVQPIEELDVVRIVSLSAQGRHFDGTDGVKREPRIGDTGTVVHAYATAEQEAKFMVEAVASSGHTLWVADFAVSELKLEVKHAGT